MTMKYASPAKITAEYTKNIRFTFAYIPRRVVG
jgi:hypothetical protein